MNLVSDYLHLWIQKKTKKRGMNNTPKKAALTKAYVSLKIRFSMAWYQRKTSSKDYEL